MRITTTVQFHNELEFLEGWYADASRYSDEIIMAAHNPTDGSLEWAREKQKISNISIKILEFPKNTIYEHGFSYMKNKMLDEATGDWIVSLDADEEMEVTKENIISFEKSTKNTFCISTVTMHVADPLPNWSLNNREQIKKEASWIRQRHFRIFKNIPEIRWHGLIHEELKLNNNIPIQSIARASVIKMWHFGCMGDKNKRHFKDGLYAELLCRAYDNHALRHGTNNWWFAKYFPENEKKLREERDKYNKELI
jgi:glycosyltransferase involved in cell wall biosynthesis